MRKYSLSILLEILSKSIAKVSSLLIRIIVMIYFGVSSAVDNYYIAYSAAGIVFLGVIWCELTLYEKIKNNYDCNEIDNVNILYSRFLFLTLLLCIISIIFSSIFYDDDVIKQLLLITVYALFFVLNSFYILVYRVQSRLNSVNKYYLLSAIMYLLGFSFIYFILDYDSIYALSISMLISEFFILIFNKKNTKVSLTFKRESYNFSSFFETKPLRTIGILLFIFFIDFTDKFTLTIIPDAEGAVSIITFGSMIPLAIRQALDAKGIFYSRIHNIDSLNAQHQCLFKTFSNV